MTKSEIITMFIMFGIIVIGVIFAVYTDFSQLFKNPFSGFGRLCKDMIPLASIILAYYLGKDK